MTEHSEGVKGWIISNEYTSAIGVAIAWPDMTCAGKFQKKGWITIKPGQKSTVLDHDLKLKGGMQLAFYALAFDGTKLWDAKKIGGNFGRLETTITDESTPFGAECVDKKEPLGPAYFRLIHVEENISSTTVVLNAANASS